MKIIAFYLPQFHDIPENDEWWGKGFTEWTNVKKAQPWFEGHVQPRIPVNDNYYNLLDDDVKVWQAELAKKYGIYGFCYYHYWFNGKLLLEKPMEQMLQNKDIDLPFCISWANEPWTRAWVGEKEVIMPQYYGDITEWKAHFDYLLPFFKDDRYIKVDGKPFFVIYRAEAVTNLNDMLDTWDQMAKENGFPGMSFAYQDVTFDLIEGRDDSRFDYNIEFQPTYSRTDKNIGTGIKSTRLWRTLRTIKRKINVLKEQRTGVDAVRANEREKTAVSREDFAEAWSYILNRKPASEKNIPGAFVGWDNTPRKGINGCVSVGDTPEAIKECFKKQIINARDNYHKDMIFVHAWNEWAEGGYLEPDNRFGYGKLEAIRDALQETNEFPW
ncbi:glycoside hydrolase family 99-like domain-containing protein [Pseudobutyrivibrio xylanivorans]|uniref:Glycosyl transferase n=1 Tax=Pseudobutyrivibrio xylanivorans TaxID=185007 RepID=A0A5P6VUH0_PSEXY|nr:glycoside hydrolase family 99-like domain-containing protein [Pseudobutyrivibrio xylanivorans]QFJ56296.1 glycosyl transferase [Pseudobutyrivibrio xylanivorans]